MTGSGNRLPVVTRSTSAVPRRRLSRVSDTVVTCAWFGHGGINSGRAVMSSSTRISGSRWIVSASNSCEVGSIQCKSSKTTSTGRLTAKSCNTAKSANNVVSLRFCGLISGKRRLSLGGSDRRFAKTPTCDGDLASRVLSLVNFSRVEVAALKSGGPFELTDKREQGTVGMVR